MPADPAGVPWSEHRPRSKGWLVSSSLPGPPVISAEAVARAWCELPPAGGGAAALVAPVGRPCARCAAVVGAHWAELARRPVGRLRHRRPRWLWRLRRPGRMPGAEARGRS